MKKIIALIMAAGALVACSGKGYVIDGTVAHAADGDIVYLMENPNLAPTDSAVVKGGAFRIKGSETDGSARYLVYNMEDPATLAYAKFYQEEGKMTAELKKNADGVPSIVKGTPVNDAVSEYAAKQAEFENKLNSLSEKYDAASDEEKAAIDKESEEIEKQYYANIENAIDKLIGSAAGVELLSSNYYSMEPEKVLDLIGKIPAGLREDNERLDRIEESVKKQLETAPGKKFTDFTMKTPEGKDISLSDYAGKGKLVLVDFWASWCGPCVREMPNVKKTYEAFHKKGFEIVGVSLDRDEQAWKDGIARLGMTWPQMSDIKYWDCEGAALYGVSSIPATVLIGPDGTIIERNLRGDALYNKVAALLK
ncbi:MAG: AhpC/TSA family protein [Bacteroidales bacterium]|nr:AhpC/TSA family protein [Bacteroidales bacterium]